MYYQYDANNQLIRENNQVLNKTISYTYDGSGNILEVNEYAYTTGTLGTPTKTKAYTYDSVWKDKLVSFDGKAITYDTIGNTKTYDNYTFTWEAGRQLGGITGNGKTISYKYNDSGIRIQKTVNGVVTNFTLEGDQVVFEKTGTDTIHYSYDTNEKLVSMNLNGSVYFYERNAQGDITGIRNNSGVQLVTYTYDSWGNIINTVDTSGISLSTKNPYRYRGYRYDEETGMYYLQSRYYNPTWGRFINADDAYILLNDQENLAQYNLYTYSYNNPINMLDYNGEKPIKIFIDTLKKIVKPLNKIWGKVSGVYKIIRLKKYVNEDKMTYIENIIKINTLGQNYKIKSFKIKELNMDTATYIEHAKYIYQEMIAILSFAMIEIEGKKWEQISQVDRVKIRDNMIAWDRSMYYNFAAGYLQKSIEIGADTIY